MNTLRLSYSNTILFWVFDADRSVSKYDTRLGRRWNVDPKRQISISDYAVLGNNPIKMIDWLGDNYINGHKMERNKAKDYFEKKENSFNNNISSEKINEGIGIPNIKNQSVYNTNVYIVKLDNLENMINSLAVRTGLIKSFVSDFNTNYHKYFEIYNRGNVYPK